MSETVPKMQNRRRLQTGLYVRSQSGLRLRYQKVRRSVQKMRAVMPWLEESDMPAARAWAEYEILASTIFAELYVHGFANAEGEPRRLLSEYRMLRQGQLAYERELGMTPAARMAMKAIGTKAALDLAAAMARVEDEHTAETGQGG